MRQWRQAGEAGAAAVGLARQERPYGDSGGRLARQERHGEAAVALARQERPW